MRHGKFRKLFNDIHLWLGLASGLILFFVCLSGTIYTFRTEIEEFFSKDLFFVNKVDGQKTMEVAELITRVEPSQDSKVTMVTIPFADNRAWSFSLKPKEKEKGRGKQVLVNPYTGQVMGSTETGSSTFFLTMMKMHRWLLMEQSTGRVVVGTATIIFALLLISGLILWLPRRLRYWKQGFSILFSGKWKRINHDLHNVLGFYSFIVLLIMALTGLCWSFEWYKDGMSGILGAQVFGQKKEKPLTSVIKTEPMIGADAAIAIANNVFDYKGTIRLSIPADSAGAFSISKNNATAWNSAAMDRVFIDAYNGTVLKTDTYSSKSFGAKVAASIRPIHTGEIYGLFSKIIYFICCLIATSLPVTGTIIWFNKLRKKKPRKVPAIVQPRPAINI